MNTSSAYQLNQEQTPAPFLVLVEKPSHVAQTPQQQAIVDSIAAMFAPKATPCASALHEPKGKLVSATVREFEVMRYDSEARILQCLETGATYHLKVTVVQVESQVFTASFINGRIVDTQDWLVNRQFAGRSMRYLYNAEQAVQGAYDHLQGLVLSGKA
jgi:hypothetical protein